MSHLCERLCPRAREDARQYPRVARTRHQALEAGVIEEWRPIAGYNSYEVSSLGRVRSLARVDAAGNRIKGRILKPRLHTGGYLRVNLCAGKARDFFIHRVVLETFVGPCPPGNEGCHNDGNRQNNAVSNLRWDTRFRNMADKKLHGTEQLGAKHWMIRKPQLVRRGEKVPTSVLTPTDVERIRDMKINGCTHKAIAGWIGLVTTENITAITRRVTWRHV